jgi:hypothetical protein
VILLFVIYILYRLDNCGDGAGGDDAYYDGFIDGCLSPLHLREYNLKYLGLIGNFFHVKDIEAAIEKGNIMAGQYLEPLFFSLFSS